ncbi:hypothetical protein MWH25_12210 [Natroniella acetigena]|uniref:HAD hydrolase family protein n=1 Tax=Natroniella acetigena TaxID=52004 RepID=UPI00200A9428|nr:HAD hydrolase family protein [Natroniella acetigena]MCK8828490.1 hypothetical protein [Natroniella acetigena]
MVQQGKLLNDLNAELVVIDSEDGSGFKRSFVQKLGSKEVIAIGNGSNDGPMLEEAAIGILVMGPEGASSNSLLKSDLVTRDINDTFKILLNFKRLVATLQK